VVAEVAGQWVEIAAATVKDECAGAGINYKTVQRAADALGVVRYKAAFGGGWRWRLPAPAEGDTKGTKSPNTQPLSTCPLRMNTRVYHVP